MLATEILMAFRFSGSKAASISAGVLFVVIVFAIFFLVGGDYAFWFFQVLPIKVSRYTETSFPLLWEYKIHLLTLVVVVLVISFLRKVNDGPVRRA
jgi:hypothetical protein